jgi:hypothetical protein
MNTAFLDLEASYEELRVELDAASRRVMESGWYILGGEVDAFERAFALYCGSKHCVGVGNGLDALILILRGYGIGPGDEVVGPANTYVASWLAASYVGAKPVPVEPNLETYNLDPDKIEDALTPHTKATGEFNTRVRSIVSREGRPKHGTDWTAPMAYRKPDVCYRKLPSEIRLGERRFNSYRPFREK